MKKCYRCQETKPLDQFFKNKSQKDGYGGYCKICSKKYEKANPQYREKWYFKRYYGITRVEKDLMLSNQNCKCAICNERFQSDKSTHVDHCHLSQKVRGILCSNCNTALGLLKDNTETLQNAIRYLQKHAGVA